MKKTFSTALFLSAVLLLLTGISQACTGIVLHDKDKKVFVPARTMEFIEEIDTKITVVPSGVQLRRLPFASSGTGGRYKTRYGFIGATAFQDDVVVDGVNEKGLYFGAFFFQGYAQFEQLVKQNRSEAISSEALGSYLLSQYATVAEVIDALPEIEVVGTYIEQLDGFAPAHYTVTDRFGDSMVIEYTETGLQVYKNKAHVITNNPTYDWHETNLANYVGLSPFNKEMQRVGNEQVAPLSEGTGLLGLPGDYTSPSRFVRAAALANSVQPIDSADNAVFEAFHILNNFDIPVGAVIDTSDKDKGARYEYTLWTSAADTSNPTYYIKNYWSQQIEKVDLLKALQGLKKVKIIEMQREFSVRDRSNDI